MTHSPPRMARLEKMVKVRLIPKSSGRPDLKKGPWDLEKMKGSTGRMQGLRIVRIPAMKLRIKKVIGVLPLSFGLKFFLEERDPFLVVLLF